MAVAYSVQTCRNLAKAFEETNVQRPLRIDRYEPGDELSYEVTGVAPAGRATVGLAVDRFVGGGFAGAVWQREQSPSSCATTTSRLRPAVRLSTVL